MAVTETALMDALKGVVDPNTGRDFVSSKSIRNVSINQGDVAFEVELAYPAQSQLAGFRQGLIAAARGVPGVANVSVNVYTKIVPHAVQRGVQLLPKVKNMVAVASGKGGAHESSCGGHERLIVQLRAVVACMNVCNHTARVFGRGESRAYETFKRPCLRTCNFDDPIARLTQRQIGQRGGGVDRRDRLHPCRREPDLVAICCGLTNRAQKLEELGRMQDRVRDA